MSLSSPSSRVRRLRAGALALVAAGSAAALGATLVPAHAAGTSADGAVVITWSGTPAVGATVSLTATVTNNGPDTVTEMIVPGSAPTGASLNSVGASQGLCAKGRNSVYTCNLGAMAPGATARIFVSATLQQSGPVVAQASLQLLGVDSDPDFTNNVSRVNFTVAGALVDVQLNGSASTKAPDAGAQFDYRYLVKNSGKDAATDARLTVNLPASATYVITGSLATTPDCTLTNTTLVCGLGTIAPGGQVDVVVTMLAPTTVGASYSATAVAAYALPDPKPANNTVVLDGTTR